MWNAFECVLFVCQVNKFSPVSLPQLFFLKHVLFPPILLTQLIEHCGACSCDFVKA